METPLAEMQAELRGSSRPLESELALQPLEKQRPAWASTPLVALLGVTLGLLVVAVLAWGLGLRIRPAESSSEPTKVITPAPRVSP